MAKRSKTLDTHALNQIASLASSRNSAKQSDISDSKLISLLENKNRIYLDYQNSDKISYYVDLSNKNNPSYNKKAQQLDQIILNKTAGSSKQITSQNFHIPLANTARQNYTNKKFDLI